MAARIKECAIFDMAPKENYLEHVRTYQEGCSIVYFLTMEALFGFEILH